jgi:hypothetical protein
MFAFLAIRAIIFDFKNPHLEARLGERWVFSSGENNDKTHDLAKVFKDSLEGLLKSDLR